MNKLLLFGLPLMLLLLLVPVITNLALASSSNEESEEEQQDQEQEQQEESEKGSGGGEVQQQSEECAVGPSTIKMIMGNESSPQFMDLYNDAIRTEEIKAYIAENVDKFDIPDWMYGTDGDSTSTFCLIASEVVEQEKTQGTRFEGSNLDDNIGLQILKKQGEIVSNVLENQ